MNVLKKNLKTLALLILMVLVFAVPLTSKAINKITSESYVISQLFDYIFRVEPKTTVDKFKGEFNIDQSLLHVYTDNTCEEELSTGNVGTGMVLAYVDEQTHETKKHDISVIGDTDKDGDITQLDLTRLIKYVVDNKNNSIDSLALLSVDMNMDGNINIIDITIMIRYIVYAQMDVDKETIVGFPSLSIQNEEGVDGWYKDDVIFTIEDDEKSKINILKNMYKIEEGEEKELKDGETVTITEEGETIVTFYSYSVYGTKSDEVTETIKIDKSAPIIGNVEASTESSNTSNITVTGITDEPSGVYQISFSQEADKYNWEANDKDTFTKQVNKNGTWYVSVKDKAGNITQTSVEVKNIVDKVSNIEIKVDGIIGINETLPVVIEYSGDARKVQIKLSDEKVLELDESIYSKEPITDEDENIIGYKETFGIKGLKEEETQFEIIIEDYDGTITTKTVKIKGVDKVNSVAMVGEVYYKTIASAIESINKDGTVRIIRNVTEDFMIPSNKSITLEIGQYTITGRINNQGNVVIASGAVENIEETIYNTGTVLIKQGKITSKVIAIHNLVNSSVTIENGEISSQNDNAILNYGTMQIKNGLISTTSSTLEAIANKNSGEITIIDGKVQATNNIAIKNQGNLTIGVKDKQVDITKPIIIGKDYGIYTTGILSWFDGNITAREILVGDVSKLEDGYLINRELKDNVQIGTLVTPRYSINDNKYVLLQDAVKAAKTGETIVLLQTITDVSNVEITKNITLDLNNYTLTRDKEIAIKENGNLNIKSGIVESTSDSAITIYMGKIKVEAASITGDKYGITQSTGSTTEIISGIIKGNVNGIKSTLQGNNIILGSTQTTVNTENPLIVGEEHGIFAKTGTQIYYYSGAIQGKQTPGYYLVQTPIYREGYVINTTLVNEYYTSKLVAMAEYSVFVKRDTSIEYYKNITEAINTVSGKNIDTTITFMRNISENFMIPENTNIELDMGEFSLIGSIINEGKLTIVSGNIVNSERVLIFNSNETYINGGNILGSVTTSPTIYNAENAKMVITNGNITSQENTAVINRGTLEVQNAVIKNKAKDAQCIITEDLGNTIIKSGNIISENNTAIYGKEGSTITIGENDGIVKTENPVITGKNYGIYAQSNVNYYDGKIQGQVAIYNSELIVANGYSVYVKNYDTYQIANLIPLSNYVKIGENVYSSLTAAIQSIETEEQVTVEILRNIEESVVIPEDVKIKLDIGNYTITGRINNKGTLNVVSGTIQNSENTVVYNTGTFNLTAGKLHSTAVESSALYNATKGSATITGGEIVSENYYAVENKENLNISGTAYIYNFKDNYETIYNYTDAKLTVTGGRISNKSETGKAINNLGIANITGGVIEPTL